MCFGWRDRSPALLLWRAAADCQGNSGSMSAWLQEACEAACPCVGLQPCPALAEAQRNRGGVVLLPRGHCPSGGGGRLSNPGGEDDSAVRNKCVSYCLKCSFWLKTICFFDVCLICLWNELMISESYFLILNMCLLMQARRQQDPSPGSNLGSGDDLKLR